jgi:hypothetical protein
VVLGIGCQGIDILFLRLLIVGLASATADVLLMPTVPLCSTNCLEWQAVGVGFEAWITAWLMVLLAIPTTIAWSRDSTSLTAEFPWRLPTSNRVSVLIVILPVVGFWAVWLLLGIPLNAP